MSVRFATDADRPAIVEVLKAAGGGAACYSFADMDGHCLVDEHEGPDGQMVIRGVALISLARPYTVIREMAIRPECQKGLVLANLSAAIFAAARAHGSTGVEGWKCGDPEWTELSRQRGAIVTAGSRVRWLLNNPEVVKLLERRERNTK